MTNEGRDTTTGPDETGSESTEHADIDETVAEPGEAEPDEAESDQAEPDQAKPDQAEPSKRRRRDIPPALRKVVYVVLALLLLGSGGTATWLYFKQYRPDQQTDPSARQAVVSSASDATTALLSYSSDSLDQDFANARSHLAGDFLTYFNDFSQQIVAPTARQRSLKTTAHVTGAAVTEQHPDSAVVLIFLDQTTTTKDNPQPSVAVNSVLVHMNRINGNWLITKFNPV